MNITLGVCGSIAAFRSPDMVKEIVARGHNCRVSLSSSAHHFVAEKTLEAFSAHKVLSSQSFDPTHTGHDHIELARWSDSFVIYAATANFLARYRSGLADDFLHTQLLAFEGPVIVAPAMNPSMWKHPATQENVKVLKNRGVQFVGPIEGVVACGESGVGHIATHESILEASKL